MTKIRGFILKPFTMITEFFADVLKRRVIRRSRERGPA
jgi:hypothetical protein